MALYAIVFAVIIIVLMRSARAWVYDTLIVRLTREWYRVVLECLPPRSVILDVGIGMLACWCEKSTKAHHCPLPFAPILLTDSGPAW